MCPANLSVPAGESIIIDCISQVSFDYTYQWTSPDASKLVYLSDVAIASPRFDAPESVTSTEHLVYFRQAFDYNGNGLEQVSVTVTVHPIITGQVQRIKDGLVEALLSKEQSPIPVPHSPQNSPSAKQTPFLRCEPRITVESGGMAEIPCMGMHPSGGILEYTVEFDWAPYSESQTLEEGDFNYFLQVPVIHEQAAVRILNITSNLPGNDEVVSQNVEVHITNQTAGLNCEDIVAEENMQTTFQCFLDASAQGARYQFISHPSLVEQGMYDHWPMFVAPEVSSDTSMSVTVRMFPPSGNHVLEQDFTLMIQNRQDILLDLIIECDPILREIYENTPEFDISCTVIGDPPTPLAWTFHERGNTPSGALTETNIAGQSGQAVFLVPENVDEHTYYTYLITAVHEQEGRSPAQEINITVLNKPTLVVECFDQETSVGAAPLDAVCEASNDQEIDLVYEWSVTPDDGRLQASDVNSLRFDVPEDQSTDLETYTYSVTASAENADAPESPTSVTITVQKSFGTLQLDCANDRLKIYEGSGEQPLECSVLGMQPEFTQPVEWNWELQEGPEDLLQPSDPAPPVFSTPELVSEATTYLYLLWIEARGYESSPQYQVVIEVLKKPVLALECPQEVMVSIGMSPQPIPCEVTNDQGDTELEYLWEWDPTTLLLETSTGTPLFVVPTEQRSYSETYPYTVTVWADVAEPVQSSTSVTVLNPLAGLSDQVDVSTSGLDLGVVGPRGKVLLDPATEQVSGLIYGGAGIHSGRMMVRAQDSVTVSLEYIESATLRQIESNHELTLVPQWAYSESCVMFSASTQISKTVQVGMSPGDCHVIRFGGAVTMEDAQIGQYTGEISVALVVNGIDQLYTVPVTLIVEAERRMVVLGPGGVHVRPAAETTSSLEWDESISIQPRVAVLGPDNPSGTFEINNPSLHPMEVAVATEFGYRETRETERFSVLVTGEDSQQGNLVDLISVYPTTVILMPGETKQIHYAIPDQIELPDQGHAILFNFTATPREYVSQTPSPVAEQVPRVIFQAPGVYIPSQGPEQLRAGIQSSTDEATVVLVETDTYPFYGQVIVKNESGHEIGSSDILVYTRSRVRVDLDEPIVGGITLEFVPYAPNQNTPLDVYVPADL